MTRRKRVRPSYKRAVEFVALNDEPSDYDEDSISGYISTIAVAVAFGKDPMEVAQAVLRVREKEDQS